MIPKEALNWCEQFIDNLVSANVDTKKRTLGLQAMQTCKSALEKQIPKKVELIDDCCLCPCCIFDMMGVYDFTDYNTKDPAFCPSCGQALDWGIGSERKFRTL